MQQQPSITRSNVAIIGCGWLGLPLAKQLLRVGYAITGTTRSHKKLTALTQSGIDALPLELGNLQDSTLKKLQNCETWILNIPSARRTVEPELFIARMLDLIEHSDNNQIKHLIFVSTTSVYGDQQGKITESYPAKPNTPSAIAHAEIEQYIQTHLCSKSSILRLAGLVDATRHPVHYLANRSEIGAPYQAVNLIHRQDVCDGIERLIDLGPQSKILHLSASEHPTRKHYYQWAAAQLGLIKPEFESDPSDTIRGKQVDATESLSRLGLELKYPSPFQMLDKHGSQ